MATNPSVPALLITPDNELVFTLSSAEATPKVTLVLSHPGHIKDHMAFKVKTTQPRRYLVRPNQGVISPGSTETIQILLVEKDKQALLQSFQRLGQSALDHSKDKFLVQSCVVSPEFASQYASGAGTTGYDALTTMWTNVTTSSSTTVVSNKKLHVRHLVAASEGAGGMASREAPDSGKSSDMSQIKNESPAAPVATVANASVASAALGGMTQQQLVAEIANLRRKYDELVAFSVNLTAERDILSNTLEQTKRDLNREMAKSAAADNHTQQNRSKAGGNTQPTRSSGGFSTTQLLLVATLFWMVGIRMEQRGMAGFVASLPVVGGMFAPPQQRAPLVVPVEPPQVVQAPPRKKQRQEEPEYEQQHQQQAQEAEETSQEHFQHSDEL